MTQPTRSAHESLFILHVWCFFCAWVVVYCAGHYLPTETGTDAARVDIVSDTSDGAVTPTSENDPIVVDGPFPTVAGLPTWVFWGIAVPWAAATVSTIAFALFGLRMEDGNV